MTWSWTRWPGSKPRWETELAAVEFAVQEVPEAEELADDSGPLPLSRVVPGSPDPQDSSRPATPSHASSCTVAR